MEEDWGNMERKKITSKLKDPLTQIFFSTFSMSIFITFSKFYTSLSHRNPSEVKGNKTWCHHHVYNNLHFLVIAPTEDNRNVLKSSTGAASS